MRNRRGLNSCATVNPGAKADPFQLSAIDSTTVRVQNTKVQKIKAADACARSPLLTPNEEVVLIYGK